MIFDGVHFAVRIDADNGQPDGKTLPPETSFFAYFRKKSPPRRLMFVQSEENTEIADASLDFPRDCGTIKAMLKKECCKHAYCYL